MLFLEGFVGFFNSVLLGRAFAALIVIVFIVIIWQWFIEFLEK